MYICVCLYIYYTCIYVGEYVYGICVYLCIYICTQNAIYHATSKIKRICFALPKIINI